MTPRPARKIKDMPRGPYTVKQMARGPVPAVVVGPPPVELSDDLPVAERRALARQYLQHAADVRRLDPVSAALLVRCAVCYWPDCALL